MKNDSSRLEDFFAKDKAANISFSAKEKTGEESVGKIV